MNLKKFMNRGLKIEFDSIIARPPGFYDDRYYGQDHCVVTLRVYNRSIFPLKDEICYTLGKYSGGCLHPSPSKPVPINLPGNIPFLKSRNSKSEWFPLEVIAYSSHNEQIIIHASVGYFIKILHGYKYELSEADQVLDEMDNLNPMYRLMFPPNIEDIEANFRSAF